MSAESTAIRQLSKSNPENQNAIAEAGGIPPLVAMLGSPSPQMTANASGALAGLCRGNADAQAAISRTGAIAPLCALVRDGSPETKEQAASALWSLANENGPNKATIAKLGGVDPLVGLLVNGTTERSQACAAGALAALAAQHTENRTAIAKKLVSLLSSKLAERAVRVLAAISSEPSLNLP